MASTYVNDLRLNEMATGDASGTWGTNTNVNLELIGEGLGYGTEGITTNADTHTSTIADGATDPVRAMYVEYTGTLDSACTITIAPNTINRMHFIENGTSGSQNIIISQGSGANITIPPGDTKAVYLDGAGSGAAVVDAFASLSVVDLKVQDDLTVTDDMTVGGTLGVTGVLTTTAATVFNGGFASNAVSTISTADNADTLTLISTDTDANSGPNLRLYRNAAGAGDDVVGRIDFEGRNDNSQDVIYGNIQGEIMDASDGSEDGQMQFGVMVAGTLRNALMIDRTEVTINEDGQDLDFRVESNGDANMLFVNGGTNRVGIGTNAPAKLVHIVGAADNAILEGLQIDNTDHASTETGQAVAINLRLSQAGTMRDAGRVTIGKDDDWDDAAATDSHMTFKTMLSNTLTEHMRITSTGAVGIGTNAPASPLHVKGTTAHTYLTVQANSGVSNAIKFIGANEWIIGNSTITGGGGDNDFSIQDGSVNAIKINGGGAVTINEGGADLDFRVESNGVTHALFVQGSDGNVSLGTTEARAKLTSFIGNPTGQGVLANSALHIANGTGTNAIGQITFGPAAQTNASSYIGELIVDTGGNTHGELLFGTRNVTTDSAPTERMRISSFGGVAIGTTSAGSRSLSVSQLATGGACILASSGNSDVSSNSPLLQCQFQGDATPASGSKLILFVNQSDVMGSITAAGTASVAYNTSSDYRMKENIIPIENGLERLNNLKPVKFDWIADGSSSEGFIAHEVQEIFSDAIIGEKDGEDMQGMDYGRITPLLVKAIQEQQTIIEDLKTRITTLEGE